KRKEGEELCKHSIPGLFPPTTPPFQRLCTAILYCSPTCNSSMLKRRNEIPMTSPPKRRRRGDPGRLAENWGSDTGGQTKNGTFHDSNGVGYSAQGFPVLNPFVNATPEWGAVRRTTLPFVPQVSNLICLLSCFRRSNICCLDVLEETSHSMEREVLWGFPIGFILSPKNHPKVLRSSHIVPRGSKINRQEFCFPLKFKLTAKKLARDDATYASVALEQQMWAIGTKRKTEVVRLG
ncbi:hypothetical protein CR513_26977, partial [Mucuna pruriens]